MEMARLLYVEYFIDYRIFDRMRADYALKLDFNWTRGRYEEVRILLQNDGMERITSDTYLLNDTFREILGITDGNESNLIKELEKCVTNDTKEEVVLPWETREILQKLSTSIPSWTEEQRNHSQQFNELVDGPEYDEWRGRLVRCLEEKERHADIMENATNTMLMLFGKYNNVVSNCTERLVIATEMEKQWQMIPEVAKNLMGPLTAACVHNDLNGDLLSAIDDLEILEENDHDLPLNKLWLEIAIEFLEPFVVRQPSIKDKVVSPYQFYLKKEKATKQKLYTVTSSNRYDFYVVAFQEILMLMEFAIDDAIKDFTEFLDVLSATFKLIYELPIPVMTNRTVQRNLVSLQFFKKEFQDDPLITNLTDQVLNLGLNGSTAFSHLMEAVTDYYVSRFTTVQEEIIIFKDLILRELTKIANDLVAFANPESQITKP